MKYAILKCVNGNYSVHAEGFTDLNAAKVSFHQLCAALWNEPAAARATVRIVDESFDLVSGCADTITHPQE